MSRNHIAIVVAIGVGLATAYMFLGMSMPSPGREPALPWPVHYFVVGPLVALLYYYVIAATLERTAAWVVTCSLGIYVFAAWFAWPVFYQRPSAAITGVVAAARGQAGAAREEWLQALIAAGRYGLPGESPPMLAVQGSDTGNVVLRSVTDGKVLVSVAIVAADEAASGGWRGCGFKGYAGEGAQEWVELERGESAVFELEPLCKEVFLDLLSYTEFRVGNETASVGDAWWTTSALVAPHGRASEGASGNSVLPRSYDARAFYGARGGED